MWDENAANNVYRHLGVLLNDPTGFPNRTDSAVTFTEGTRTLQIAPVASYFDVYVQGKQFRKTAAVTATWTDADGAHWFYFDASGELQHTTTITNAIVRSMAIVAAVGWNATGNYAYYKADERHGVNMPGDAHLLFHMAFGAQIIPGSGTDETGPFVPAVTAEGNGNSAGHAQIGFGAGQIADEDIIFERDALSSPATIPILYRSGASAWAWKTPDAYPVVTTGTGRMAYNLLSEGSWSLSEITNNQFGFVHFFATNDVTYPVIGILGQEDYTSISSARSAATTELQRLKFKGLPIAEMAPICTVAFQTSDSYGNAVKSRVREISTGVNWVDFRPSFRAVLA